MGQLDFGSWEARAMPRGPRGERRPADIVLRCGHGSADRDRRDRGQPLQHRLGQLCVVRAGKGAALARLFGKQGKFFNRKSIQSPLLIFYESIHNYPRSSHDFLANVVIYVISIAVPGVFRMLCY